MAPAPSVGAALGTLLSAVLSACGSRIESSRPAILAKVHDAATAPLAVQAGQVLTAAVAGGGLEMSVLRDAVSANLPTFQTNLTNALDAKAGVLFDWGIATLGKVASRLAS